MKRLLAWGVAALLLANVAQAQFLPIGTGERIVVACRNPDVSTAEEPLWNNSTAHTWQAGAVQHYISSTSAADTTQYFEVHGLDANYDRVTTTTRLAGQTKTAVGVFLRVNLVKNVGSINNAGIIYVYEDDTVTAGVPQTTAKIHAHLIVGANQSYIGWYTVPRGFRGYLNGMYVFGYRLSGADAVVFSGSLRWREPGGVFVSRYPIQFSDVTGGFQIPFMMGAEFPEKADVAFFFTATASAAMVAGFNILLLPFP